MFRKPRKRLLWRMKREIAKVKMEFAKEESYNTDLSPNLVANLDLVKKECNSSSDLITRRFTLGSSEKDEGAIVFIDGLVDKKQVEWSILRPLMLMGDHISGKLDPSDPLKYMESRLITVGEVYRGEKLENIVAGIMSGNTVLLLNGSKEALIIATPGWEKRGVEQPDAEVIIKGPREGFVETLRSNTALLRRRLGDPGLTFENLQIGRETKTDVCIAAIKGIVAPGLVEELKRRLQRIDTDGVVAAGTIEEFIEDAPFSIFATVGNTERPDVVCAKLLEGRAAVLVDGTPVALTVPLLYVEHFQSPDDYIFRPFFANVVRWVRYVAFWSSILLPATYVALTAFHQELIPTELLITMAAATEGTPFPAVVEALVMGLIFEILREAGIRLPRPIGQAVSIVGALVIGEATVTAGLVGAPLIIVIALTAICSFVNPNVVEESTIIRFSLTIMAGFLGAFGIAIGLLALLVHLASLRSFGVPLLSPVAPTALRDMAQDVIIRAPWWMMFTRPKVIGSPNRKRQVFYSRPRPPQKGNEDDNEI